MNSKGNTVFSILLVTTFIALASVITYAETVTHTYDDLNRLKRSEYSDGTVLIYDYDKIGNRTLKQKFYKPHVLTVQKTGSGTGTVTSAPAPARINCGTACSQASATFSESTAITLTAAPDGSYVFTGWSGGGCGTSASCTLSMTADTHVAAIFQPSTCANMPVKNQSTGIFYSSLQTAYNAAADGAAIRSQAVILVENLNANRAITVTLDGGYECGYSSKTGSTTLTGSVTTNNGATTMQDFVLQQ
jgi:hypothetical protein